MIIGVAKSILRILPRNKIKVTLFGATGQAGKHIAKECLRSGHALTAYARQEHLSIPVSKLITGELDDEAKLAEALNGAQVIISALADRDYESEIQVVTPFCTAGSYPDSTKPKVDYRGWIWVDAIEV